MLDGAMGALDFDDLIALTALVLSENETTSSKEEVGSNYIKPCNGFQDVSESTSCFS